MKQPAGRRSQPSGGVGLHGNTEDRIHVNPSIGESPGQAAHIPPDLEIRPSARRAIAHEWITQRAGSEKTFEQISVVFPEADLFALTHTAGVEVSTGGRQINTTWIDRAPVLRTRRALSLPLMPMAWRTVSSETYDTVISSSHACAKGFGPGRDALHLSYMHAPMRYAWNAAIDGRAGGPVDLLAPARAVMRRWDRRSADWVDSFAANSSAVAQRINDYYDREARVIAPPVDVTYFSDAPRLPRTHLLAFSRFVTYKRLDIAIGVSERLGIPLVIAGSGPEEANLRAEADRLAPGQVTFSISPSQAELRELYARSLALVFPAHEDFGIIPVEAQAAGCPVLALNKGGSLDTVAHKVSGYLVEEQTIESFADGAVRLLDASPDPWACQRNAADFGAHRFRREIREWVAETEARS